jgi:L-alanine-DL-glutamate epimerase-like enolase superfamily enzyme
VRATIRERRVRLREPLATAWGPLETRTLFALEVEGADGVVGLGEAAPLEPYDGVSDGDCRDALARLARVLERVGDVLGPAALLDACLAAADLPQALAAVDLALWDRAGRRAGQPVAELLASSPLAAVPVNATIGAVDRARAADAAARAAAEGFPCVKVKVGAGDDAGRVAAGRAAAGPHMALRLDANGAWGVAEAVAAIAALSPAGLELVEEPVHGVAAMRAVRERVAVRIAMDETAGEPGSLTAAVADAVCLKVGRCGGISGLLAQAALVRATGAEVYLASAYDGPLGVAAAVHCAAALRPSAACGLGTLALFAGVPDSLPVRGGAIAVPTAAGLGV